MKFEILELQETDTIVIAHDIGNLSPSDVDTYCNKYLDTLKSVFGTKIALFPVRGLEEAWQFTVIRKPKSSQKVTTVDVNNLSPERVDKVINKLKKRKR